MAINTYALKAASSVAAFWDDARFRAKSRLGLVSLPVRMGAEPAPARSLH